MNHILRVSICRLLMVLTAWMPFQVAQAGMIGTEKAVPGVAQADRAAVVSFLQRADVAQQLQAFGVDLATAKDRVNAMTDEEVRTLAGQIDSLPAGGLTHSAKVLIVVIIIVAIVWWVAKPF
jgi:uncharacterized protein DUF6627